MRRTNSTGTLVYSTETGRVNKESGKSTPNRTGLVQQGGTCNPADGIVRISRETKGRKGAGVTLVRGLDLAPELLKAMAGQLKQRCGSGGTIKDGIIEIQGDHRQLLLVELAKQGFKVKLAGG